MRPKVKPKGPSPLTQCLQTSCSPGQQGPNSSHVSLDAAACMAICPANQEATRHVHNHAMYALVTFLQLPSPSHACPGPCPFVPARQLQQTDENTCLPSCHGFLPRHQPITNCSCTQHARPRPRQTLFVVCMQVSRCRWISSKNKQS